MAKLKAGLVQNRYRREQVDPGGKLRVVGVSFLNAQPHLHGLLSGLGEERMSVSLAEPSELARRLYDRQLPWIDCVHSSLRSAEGTHYTISR